MSTVQLVQVGDELGIELPSEVLARLALELGDTLYLTDTGSALRLSADDLDAPIDRSAKGQARPATRPVQKRK
jgi:hypothetical protein